jgi:hypothetical protein
MKVFSILILTVCILVLVACTKDIGPNPDLVKTEFCDTITFTKHVKPIIIKRCVSCHTAGGFAAAYGDFNTDTYTGIKPKVDNGTFKGRVIDLTITPTMPFGMTALPADTIAILKCWLEAGAPNN